MAGDAISAGDMALAARYDPQFAVPHRPRLRRGVVIRRYGDRLLVDGTPTRHVLRGSAATDLVARLLPLLDGTRGHDLLAEAGDAPVTDVFAAVSLLWTCGVVEEAAPSNVDVSAVSEHLADYLSRIGDSTATHSAWEYAAAALGAARLEVFGPGSFVQSVLDELGETVPARVGQGSTPEPETTLAVLCTVDGRCAEEYADLADSCWSTGTPLLRVDLTAGTVEIGPYVDRRFGPCLACQLATATVPATYEGDDDVTLAAALVAADLVALIGRASAVPLPSRWRRVNLTRLASSTRSGATRPGCPLCSVSVTGLRVPGLAARYEAAVALPPREFAIPKAHQMHYKPANVALQRGHRTWPTAPRVGLPEPKWERLTGTAQGSAAIDLDLVSLLLTVAAGWREDRPDRVLRWTASGGNIGSPTAYLVVRNLDGLAPGSYGYIPSTHELALLREDNPALESGALLVLTADLGRVAHKYSAFGLRVVLLDAGCAMATLLATADASGLPCRPESGWDDEGIAGLLHLDPAEPITGVLRLEGGR